MSAGIKSVRGGGNFFTGKGYTINFSHEISKDVSDKPIVIGKDMEYSNAYAKKFSDDYFGKIKGLNKLYADGSIPKGAKLTVSKNGNVFTVDKEKLNGTSVYLGKAKGTNIYLYKISFTSKEMLYLVMLHEYSHVFYANADYSDFNKEIEPQMHYRIAEMQKSQAKLWDLNYEGYNSKMQKCNSIMDLNNIKLELPTPQKVSNEYLFLINTRPWL